MGSYWIVLLNCVLLDIFHYLYYKLSTNIQNMLPIPSRQEPE